MTYPACTMQRTVINFISDTGAVLRAELAQCRD